MKITELENFNEYDFLFNMDYIINKYFSKSEIFQIKKKTIEIDENSKEIFKKYIEREEIFLSTVQLEFNKYYFNPILYSYLGNINNSIVKYDSKLNLFIIDEVKIPIDYSFSINLDFRKINTLLYNQNLFIIIIQVFFNSILFLINKKLLLYFNLFSFFVLIYLFFMKTVVFYLLYIILNSVGFFLSCGVE